MRSRIFSWCASSSSWNVHPLKSSRDSLSAFCKGSSSLQVSSVSLIEYCTFFAWVVGRSCHVILSGADASRDLRAEAMFGTCTSFLSDRVSSAHENLAYTGISCDRRYSKSLCSCVILSASKEHNLICIWTHTAISGGAWLHLGWRLQTRRRCAHFLGGPG